MIECHLLSVPELELKVSDSVTSSFSLSPDHLIHHQFLFSLKSVYFFPLKIPHSHVHIPEAHQHLTYRITQVSHTGLH